MNLFERKSNYEKTHHFELFYAGDIKQITMMLSGKDDSEVPDEDPGSEQTLREMLSGQLF